MKSRINLITIYFKTDNDKKRDEKEKKRVF